VQTYYTPEHVRTILKRTAASPKGRMKMTLHMIIWFYLAITFEGVHPLEAGIFRLKARRDRRAGLSRENPLTFYPRVYGGELLKWARALPIFLRFDRMRREAEKSPDRWAYTDVAIAPPQADEYETLDLYLATAGGGAALARKRRDDVIRARVRPSLPGIETAG